MTHSTFNPMQLLFYNLLLRVRPAEFGELLKKWIGIKRKTIPCDNNFCFWADPVSVFGQALLRDHIYEPQMSKLVTSLLKSGDTFVDIGGNEGYFTALAARKEARVFCIEPQSRLLPVIEKNLELNNCKNVTVSNLAFSDKEGQTEIYLRPTTNTGSSSFFQVSKFSSLKESVKTVTLDDYFKANKIEHVRLMKIDCEGAESLVMKGATHVFKNKTVEILALEYHPQVLSENDISEIDLFLKECGYLLVKWNDQTIYCLPEFKKEITSLR